MERCRLGRGGLSWSYSNVSGLLCLAHKSRNRVVSKQPLRIMIEQCFKIKCTVKATDPQKVATAYRNSYIQGKDIFFIFKNWSVVHLQYPVSVLCTAQWFSYIYIYIYTHLNILWKDWCWSWNSNTLATWCKELTHWKSPWCWARLKAGGEGGNREWDGWMALLTQWTWVWVNSGS